MEQYSVKWIMWNFLFTKLYLSLSARLRMKTINISEEQLEMARWKPISTY